MEHYYNWHLHEPHFKQSQLPLILFPKRRTKQAGIKRKTLETWKISVVHKHRGDEAEKYEKNFQRNSDRDMEEKFWKPFTKIQSDKILTVTEKLRLNVYSPFYFLPSYKYSILKFYVISKTMQNRA